MKRLLLLVFAVCIIIKLQGQGTDCLSAAPFCTGTTYNFPAVTGVLSPNPMPVYPNYGCLISIPNPAWYYMRICTPGDLVIHISSSPSEDVDFICWGPFGSIATACGDSLTGNCAGSYCSGGSCPDNTGSCYISGFYPSGNITDCSMSANASEDCHIYGALTGQYYILLITNYSDIPCNIIFAQSNEGLPGAASTNCAVLAPITSHNPLICIGDTLKLYADTIPNAAYYWTGPGAWQSNIQNPIRLNATATMSGNYVCHVVICGEPSPYDTLPVVINPVPVVTVTSDSICIGDTATLTASGASTYQWSDPLASTINPLLISPTVTTNYYVIGKSAAGCTDTAYASVTVKPSPNITVNSPTICIGDTATLTASGAVSYIWDNNPLFNNNPIYFNPTATTTYTVIGKDINNCIGNATATVTVYPPPVIEVSNDTTICAGTYVTLTASGGLSYLWTIPNVGTETTASINVNPLVITTYNLVVTDANNCKKDTSVIVKTTPLPVPTLTLTNDTICSGASTEIIAAGGSNYLWSPNGEITSTITVQPSITTTYSVIVSKLINGLMCSATASIVQIVRNCNSIFIPNAFSPYGHNSTFKPVGNISNLADYNFQIWDRWGQLLFETTNHEMGWDGRNKGELMPVGVYVYHLRLDDKINPVYEKIGTVTLIK